VSDRSRAERRVGLARLWARAPPVQTTAPSASGDDDAMVDEEAARVLAAQAGRLKGGLAKVAQLAGYAPAAGGRRAVLGELWDRAPAVSSASVSRVVEEELGMSPQRAFARWDGTPLAAASLGQVHAATLHDGTEVVVKVQYPGIADALRADLDDPAFVRKLAGTEIGRSLDDDAVRALADAVRDELDYTVEADAQRAFAAAWAGDAAIAVPAVVDALSTRRVLVSARARGRTIVDVAATSSPELRAGAALAIYRFAWGSPIIHGWLNADPNPGNFLVEPESGKDGRARLWCLDFGCALELDDALRASDRELWHGLLDDGTAAIPGAERFRVALAESGLLHRADTLATVAHRDWERALAQPLQTHGDFHWSAAYAAELADSTSRVLAAGGVRLPAARVLLWRQRLGAASVIAMLDARAPFRRTLVELIGTGRSTLR
jgi:predicted unusual protein kinase regulating ubiquinone biosynthesis (AarF/ABC1/UbiB family)